MGDYRGASALGREDYISDSAAPLAKYAVCDQTKPNAQNIQKHRRGLQKNQTLLTGSFAGFPRNAPLARTQNRTVRLGRASRNKSHTSLMNSSITSFNSFTCFSSASVLSRYSCSKFTCCSRLAVFSSKPKAQKNLVPKTLNLNLPNSFGPSENLSLTTPAPNNQTPLARRQPADWTSLARRQPADRTSQKIFNRLSCERPRPIEKQKNGTPRAQLEPPSGDPPDASPKYWLVVARVFQPAVLTSSLTNDRSS